MRTDGPGADVQPGVRVAAAAPSSLPGCFGVVIPAVLWGKNFCGWLTQLKKKKNLTCENEMSVIQFFVLKPTFEKRRQHLIPAVGLRVLWAASRPWVCRNLP